MHDVWSSTIIVGETSPTPRRRVACTELVVRGNHLNVIGIVVVGASASITVDGISNRVDVFTLDRSQQDDDSNAMLELEVVLRGGRISNHRPPHVTTTRGTADTMLSVNTIEVTATSAEWLLRYLTH